MGISRAGPAALACVRGRGAAARRGPGAARHQAAEPLTGVGPAASLPAMRRLVTVGTLVLLGLAAGLAAGIAVGLFVGQRESLPAGPFAIALARPDASALPASHGAMYAPKRALVSPLSRASDGALGGALNIALDEARDGARSHAQSPAQEPRLYLPSALQYLSDPKVRASATARAATEAARPSTTPTPSPRPSPSASPTGVPSASPTADGSSTPGATPGSATPSPSPSPSPDRTRAPSPTPTPSPGPAFEVRDPEASLRPLAAEREADQLVYWDEQRQGYLFDARHEAGNRTYELEWNHPDQQRGRLAIRDLETGVYPVAGAGLNYRRLDGVELEPRQLDPAWPVTARSHELVDGVLRIDVVEELEGREHRKRYEIELIGHALRIRARSLDGRGPERGRYSGFSAGAIEPVREALPIRVPYAESVPLSLVDGQSFMSTLLDAPHSGAGQWWPRGPRREGSAFVHETSALLVADADGTVSDVDEALWVVVSDRVEDAFPRLEGPPAPWRDALVGQIHAYLDGRAPAVDAQDKAAYLAQLEQWGLRDLVVHDAGWSDPRDPPPGHAPDPASGGEGGLRALAAAAGRLTVALAYTSTVAGCGGADPNPSYDPDARVLGEDGQWRRLETDFACPGQASAERWLLSPSAASTPAADDAARLAAQRVGGAVLDHEALWSPAWTWPGADGSVLDRAADADRADSVGAAIRAYQSLFAGLQASLGPVIAEGSAPPWEARFDRFHGGYLDAVTGAPSRGPIGDQIAGDDAPVVPDYVLRVGRLGSVPFGLGAYEDFFGRPLVGRLGEAELDALRVTQLAYGHAGAFRASGAPGFDAEGPISQAEAVKEYYQLLPVQTRVLSAPIDAIFYVAPNGEEHDLSSALRAGLDLVNPRLRIRYGAPGRLALSLNLSPTLWSVDTLEGSRLLPPDGWLIEGDDLRGYSALEEGRRVDLLETPDYTLMDGRGQETAFGRLRARDLALEFRDGRRLEEAVDGSLSWVRP